MVGAAGGLSPPASGGEHAGMPTRPPLRVLIVTPAGSRGGNRVTALRIAGLLRSLRHRVRVRTTDDGAPADVLVALHARKSAAAVAAFAARAPHAPIVVVLTGTDVYPRFDPHPDALASVERAARLVALQPLAVAALPAALRAKARVVLQSASSPPVASRGQDTFDVCVLAHLRHVKDPLLPARAVALLPPEVPVRVLHAGGVIDEDLRAPAEALQGARYRWLGPVSRARTRELLATSRALVLPSRSEGGANVLSEAVAAGLPVLASDVPGNTGLLGADHPGLFAAGDARALAALLERAWREPAFLERVRQRSEQLQPMFTPARERAAWDELLAEILPASARP
jgi:putative glycosyltransferase (TIGR04348 family)